MHPLRLVPERVPRLREGRRPRLRLGLLGPDRRGADAAARGDAARAGPRAAVPELALRRLHRGLPGRHPAARPARARARRGGAGRRVERAPSAPPGAPGRAPGRARAATGRRARRLAGPLLARVLPAAAAWGARTRRCRRSTRGRSTRAGPRSSARRVIEHFLDEVAAYGGVARRCRRLGRCPQRRRRSSPSSGRETVCCWEGDALVAAIEPATLASDAPPAQARCRHHGRLARGRRDRHARAHLRRRARPWRSGCCPTCTSRLAAERIVDGLPRRAALSPTRERRRAPSRSSPARARRRTSRRSASSACTARGGWRVVVVG